MSLDKLPFFSSKLNSPKLQISDKDKGNNAILPDLMGEFEGRKLFKYSRMAMLVCELYINLARLYEEERPHLVQQNPLYSGKFRELEKTIDVHFVREKGVEFYAEKLNMSSRHLNRICRQVAGKTFSRIITERIMLEARHLLSSTDLSFNEIARQLGYEEYSYFSKLFKQYCGVNLRDFKVRYI
jgi:AraC-like DNA-binding protein